MASLLQGPNRSQRLDHCLLQLTKVRKRTMTVSESLGRQTTLFICLYVGYVFYVYCRKSFSYSAAAIADKQGLRKSDLGLIVSSQALAYTLGKFVSGILVDKFSPKWMFCVGLFSSGLSTIAFTYSGNVRIFTAVWFVNGLSGGPGWPAAAKFLKICYPASQLGTLWSALSTSMNVAGSLGPMLGASLVSVYGWRMAMYLSGLVAIIFSIVSLLLIQDIPSSQGTQDNEKKDSSPKNEVAITDILNPFFFKLCVCFLVTMCIRSACLDWGHLYLIQDLGHSHIIGSSFTSFQEVGGIIGSITAGYISDQLVSKLGYGSIVGRIAVILVSCCITSLCLLFLLTIVSTNVSQVLLSVLGLILGFSLYGPIALYGVMAVESAPSHLSGTAHSIAAASANIGMVLSGLPLSWIATHYQWTGAFSVLFIISSIPVLLGLIICLHPPEHHKKLS